MTLNPNIFPKGGFWFKDSDGSTIHGDTWPGVAARLKRYRERQGRPVGDPMGEVIAQACQREPVICVQDNPAYDHQIKRGNLKGRVLTWLAQVQARSAKGEVQFVSDATRNDRVNTCAGCPFNKELPGGCATCKAAVEESRKHIIGGRPVDHRNHACDVLGEDVPVSTWIESIAEDRGDLPAHCWRKRSL